MFGLRLPSSLGWTWLASPAELWLRFDARPSSGWVDVV
jgi:hypothetical protein